MPSLFLRPMSVTYISKKILWYAWMQSSIPLKLISEWIMSLCHRVSFTFKYPLFPITDASEVVLSNIIHWSRWPSQTKFDTIWLTYTFRRATSPTFPEDYTPKLNPASQN